MPETPKLLVINADDLGMTPGINRAIIQAHRGGIVTSSSLIANGAASEDAIAQLKTCPGLDVGLHVNLTQGRPNGVAKSSLVDRNGNFYSLAALAARLSLGAIAATDVETEIAAQAQWTARAGIAITHFDSHEHVHLHPIVTAALSKVARRMKVPWIRFNAQRAVLPPLLREAGLLRLGDQARYWIVVLASLFSMPRFSKAADDSAPMPRWLVGAPQLFPRSPRHLLGAMMRSIDGGVTEWVCHPGYADADLRALIPPAHAAWREAELKLLTDPESAKLLQAAGIRLVSYAQLQLSEGSAP